MKVSVIGAGYVGLVSGVCLAEKGHQVVCVDIDHERVDNINRGITPIHEKGLEELLKRNINDNLIATAELRRAVMETDLTMIAVGTPFDGNEIDLTYIKKASEQIGSVLKEKNDYHIVVLKSTAVPGTTENVVLPILEQASGKKAGRDFGVGVNPEFLREGEAIQDFMHPDRIVIGGIDERSTAALEDLYSVFDNVDKVCVDPKTAELIKYTSNALLATLISFSNEIGNLSATIGVDITDVMRGVHLDRRFTPILEDGVRIWPSFITYLAAGCGFGGSCFPKDIKALIAFGEKTGSSTRILRAVIDVNDAQPQKMVELLKRHHPMLDGLKVAVLGMAFKPGTDDIRESPSLRVTKALLDENAVVTAFDPVARHEAEKYFRAQVAFYDDLEEAIAGVDAIFIMTSWEHFKTVPLLIALLENPPLVVDGRRMLDKKSVVTYEGIGL